MEARLIDALIGAVRDVARQEILPRFRDLSPGDVETKSGPEDLVTVADRQAEAALTRHLAQILPGVDVVGEEACEEDPGLLGRVGQPGLVAIVDPVDGTTNFVAGLATFGVILAVEEDGETRFGLCYDPVLDDWMAATPGGGAWYGRPDGTSRPIRTRAPRAPRDEVGFVALALFDRPAQDAVAPTLPEYGRALSLRCSCHEYRQVASGRADWVFSPQSKPWDHRAGQLLVAEAGGGNAALRGDWTGAEPDRWLISASTPDRARTLAERHAHLA